MIDPIEFVTWILQGHPELFGGKPYARIIYKLISITPPLPKDCYYPIHELWSCASGFEDRIPFTPLVNVMQELNLEPEFRIIQTQFPKDFYQTTNWNLLRKGPGDLETYLYVYQKDMRYDVCFPSAHETIWAQAQLESLLSQIK